MKPAAAGRAAVTAGHAAVLAVGDELLGGGTLERNSAAIAAALVELGIEVRSVRVERDDEEPVARALAELARSVRFVFVTGGLGPTLDDVTRHAAARATGVELEECPRALAEVALWWRERGEPMPEANRRQALLPRGSVRLPNRAGTAPGFRLELGSAVVFALPGPPAEMRDMLEREVLPWLAARVAVLPLGRADFHLFGLSESHFAERVGDWMARGANPEVGVTASRGVLSVRMRARAATREEAERVLAERVEAFRERFEEHIFSEVGPALEHAVGRVLLERRISVSVAESCTGGLVAGMLTSVPGISAVLEEAFVTYSDEAKTRRLGVPHELIAGSGAVSSEVAAAMARGAAQMSGARLTVSVTGIAGPSGGTQEKPVGLVWFGVCADGRVETCSRRYPARSRAFVRDLAARSALHLLWTHAPGGRPRPERRAPSAH